MNFFRIVWTVLVLATLALGCLWNTGSAGDKNAEPWKIFLPPEAYKELVSRELKTVQAGIATDDAKAVQKAKVAALMIAACTFSTKEPAEGVRAVALRLAEIVGDKEKATEAKKLSEAISAGPGDAAVKNLGDNFRQYVPKEYDLMVPYMGKVKGGDGLHPDLQFSDRLKEGEEYIENLFSYLAKKPLAEAKVKKGAKELELTGYHTAVSAELILSYVPKTKSKKRDPELWLQTGTLMRDSALDLAAAANKQDAAAIQKAGAAILDSCVKCHKMFQ